MITPYPYQLECVNATEADWAAGVRTVFLELPTGGGKTVIFSHILHQHNVPSLAIAHRRELVSQISLSLARYGHRHRIIAPDSVVKYVSQLHYERLGASFYDPGARCAVASVDTLLNRTDELASFLRQVQLAVMDEGHHVLRANKWGRALQLVPNAKILLVSANATRGDGKGLGLHADGYAESLVRGPGMRWLIENGYLSDYRIIAPPTPLHRERIPIAPSGELSPKYLDLEMKRTPIMGDVVRHYREYAEGELGVTFAHSVEAAVELAAEYSNAGIPAAVVTNKTPDRERFETIRRFERRQLLQLCNVGIFGEGFDLPALVAVSDVQATQSYQLFSQKFGRCVRVAEGKDRGIYLDHVGNVEIHKPPDIPRYFTLDGRERRSNGDVGDECPYTTCPGCLEPYPRPLKHCPNPDCDYVAIPTRRDDPEFVDGDLVELDGAALARLRAEVERIDEDPNQAYSRALSAGMPRAAAMGMRARHTERQNAQRSLRAVMDAWAAVQASLGRDQSERHKRFYFRYGVDALSARSLGWREAHDLNRRIVNDLRGAYGDHI